MLWWLFAAITAVASALILYPLWRPTVRPRREAYDIEVYKAQLSEVDSDKQRGTLTTEEAEAARIEIERRLLRADNQQGAQPPPEDSGKKDLSSMDLETLARRFLVPLVIAGVLFASFLLYGKLGSPRIPDMPLEQREQASETLSPEAMVSTLSELADKLAARLEADPNDGDGWRLLGRTNQELGRYGDAAAAYARAAAIFPDEADLRAYVGENLVFEAKGTVTPRAKRAFEAALELKSDIPAARYYVGLAHYQAGEFQRAYDLWLALGRASRVEAPWLADLQKDIDRAAAGAGIDAARIVPGMAPSADEVAAAEALSSQEREAMIRGMVDRLADRLRNDPNDAEGWMRLGKARSVLGETVAAAEAYGKAAELQPGDLDAQTASAHALLKTVPKGTPVPENVLAAFERVHGLDPKNFDGLWFTGLGHLQAGREDQARHYWERAREGLAQDDPRLRVVADQLQNLTGR